MSGRGYGIAGHKNSYSSRVKDGNWIEDHIGQELAEARQRQGPPEFKPQSETQEKLIDPRNMVAHPKMQAAQFATAEEIMMKNRTGLRYEELFAHHGDPDPEERYRTTTDDDCGVPVGIRTKLMQARDASRSAHEIEDSMTETQRMNMVAEQTADEFIVRVPPGPQNIPTFNRVKSGCAFPGT